MPSNGFGTGIDSPTLAPQEAAEKNLRSLLPSVPKHFAIAFSRGKRSVRAVHQLRVASRRTAAALDIYQDILPSTQVVWFRKKLKEVRRLAGCLRELDVLACRMSEAKADGKKSKRARNQVIRLLRNQRRIARKPLQHQFTKLIESGTFGKRSERLLKGLSVSRMQSQSPFASDHSSVRLQIYLRLQMIAERFLKASQFSIDDLDSIHQFRLRTKELRYALEILSKELPKSFTDDFLPMFTVLQEKLGEFNDHAGAWERLKKLARTCRGMKRRYLKKHARLSKKRLESAKESLVDLLTPESEQMLKSHLEALVNQFTPQVVS